MEHTTLYNKHYVYNSTASIFECDTEMNSMCSVRPPPGLESTVSLTSIASILVPSKKLATIESEENFQRLKQQIWATNNEQKRQSINGQFVDDRSNRNKRSAELAAVANNCALNKDFESAITFYSDAIDLNPTDFRFYCNRSFCYENIKQYNNSLEDALKANQLNPHRPKPYFRRGRALLGLKRYEEAEEAFKQVLKIDPDCEATISELIQVRYIALREIGFDIDAALLAAKRCNSIAEAIDFVVNIELLSLKSTDSSESDERCMSFSTDSTTNTASIPTTDTTVTFAAEVEFDKTNTDFSRSNNLKNLTTNSTNAENNFTKTSAFQSPKSCVGPTNLFGYKGLWVGNIYPKANANTLRALFSKYGKVLSVKILKDKFCAFISYDNANSPRKAISDLNESCVKNVSNEYRPLKFRFIPTSDQPDLNFARPVQPRNNNNECYFWRTTGCNAGDKCKLRHVPICKGIDFQPWMSRT